MLEFFELSKGPDAYRDRAFRMSGVRCAMANRYGYPHTLERRRWAMALLAQSLPCTVCGKSVTAVMDWHLDHNDAGTGYLGVAHAACNTRKGAIKGNKMRATESPARWLKL